ncbi:serine protease [bacterium]|nr:serine protease [bacterium]
MSKGQVLSNATGFFFERDEQLFLVTNRHVVCNESTNHAPDALDLELHVSESNIAEVTSYSIPLYNGKVPTWRETTDAAGIVDVVVLPVDKTQLPPTVVYRAFTPEKLVEELDEVEVGTPLLVVGFPLGFHDTLHHLPVARHAIIASAFGLRFQGSGCFLTDGRTHRGISGAPVVTRFSSRRGRSSLPYSLLGIHASRIDMNSRDLQQDEALGLNCAWYADVLLTLTDASYEQPAEQPEAEDPATVASPSPAANVTVPAEAKARA